MIITLNEAKKYLRVDYTDDDTLIRKFIKTGMKLVEDTLRKELEATPANKTAVLYVVFQYVILVRLPVGVLFQ